MAIIKIDTDRSIADIHPHIFGGFAEHLGRCIYGGLYDPGCAHADDQGFRRDVIQALHDLRMGIMRWPGGNFVSGYHWRDGIGASDQRPTRVDVAWGALESNRFGTDEFVELCRVARWEPYICVNMGTGSLQEAADWVEYCNRPATSAVAQLRAENGYREPHRVRYWGLGNEVYGHWQIGHKDAVAYAKLAREFGKLMRWVDPEISLIACGANDPEWDRAVLQHTGDLVDYISIHFYVGNREGNFAEYMAAGRWVDERLAILVGTIVSALGPRTKIRIAVDEWNVWYRTSGAPNSHNTLEEVYNFEDALVVAQFIHSFIRQARWVKMANLAQVVNVIAPLMTHGDRLVKQTIYHSLHMLAAATGQTALDVYVDCESYESKHGRVPYLDVVASRHADGSVALSVINRHGTTSIRAQVINQNGQWGSWRGTQLAGYDPRDQNTLDDPDKVVPATLGGQASAGQGTVLLEFPPASLTVLRLA